MSHVHFHQLLRQLKYRVLAHMSFEEKVGGADEGQVISH